MIKKKIIKKLSFMPKTTKIVYKKIKCALCNEFVKVESDIVKVVCYKCCAKYGPNIVDKKEIQNTGFPKGWKFFNQFVHIDGRVFEKGIENEKLKGKLEPTVIVKKPKLTKKQREQKKEEKEKKAVLLYQKKKILKIKEEKNKEKLKVLKQHYQKFFKD